MFNGRPSRHKPWPGAPGPICRRGQTDTVHTTTGPVQPSQSQPKIAHCYVVKLVLSCSWDPCTCGLGPKLCSLSRGWHRTSAARAAGALYTGWPLASRGGDAHVHMRHPLLTQMRCFEFRRPGRADTPRPLLSA